MICDSVIVVLVTFTFKNIQSHRTLRTTVSRGCKLARPPGGREEQPVVNCRKALRSSAVKWDITFTNRRKPGLKIK